MPESRRTGCSLIFYRKDDNLMTIDVDKKQQILEGHWIGFKIKTIIIYAVVWTYKYNPESRTIQNVPMSNSLVLELM